MSPIARRHVISLAIAAAVAPKLSQAAELPQAKIDIQIDIDKLFELIGEWVGEVTKFWLAQKERDRAESVAELVADLSRLAGGEVGFADAVEQVAIRTKSSPAELELQTRYLRALIYKLTVQLVELQMLLGGLDPNWAAKHPQLVSRICEATTNHETIFLLTRNGRIALSDKEATKKFVAAVRADSRKLMQLAASVSKTLAES